MSVVLLENTCEKFVVIRPTGRLTGDDYLELDPRLEECIRRRGRVRILLDMRACRGWDFRALRGYLRFELRHYCEIDRLAIVGGAGLSRWSSKIHWLFSGAVIRYFGATEIERAREWIGKALPGESAGPG